MPHTEQASKPLPALSREIPLQQGELPLWLQVTRGITFYSHWDVLHITHGICATGGVLSHASLTNMVIGAALKGA